MESGVQSVPVMEEVSSRRGLFKLAGAVATGAIASTMASASPAAAADGSAFVLNGTNTTTAAVTTLTRTSSTDEAALSVIHNSSGTALGDAIVGESKGTPKGAGVIGKSDTGFGIYGASLSGYSVYAGGNGRLGMSAGLSAVGPPSTGTYDAGDIIRDLIKNSSDVVIGSNVWICVKSGVGPAAVWRKLGGLESAGQLHLLPSPLRAYDSRPGSSAATGGEGSLLINTERIISLAQGKNNQTSVVSVAVPAGASGAMLSMTLAETQGPGGFLGVFQAGTSWPGTSNLNWFGPGQILAATVVSAVDSSRRITVRSGGVGTQLIIDVVGYFL